MPCGITTFYYHPGIFAIMYMMDDKKSVIIKADRSITAADDLCKTKKHL
jgi:hypothetical protein